VRGGVRGTVEVWESGVAVGRIPDSKLGGVGDEGVVVLGVEGIEDIECAGRRQDHLHLHLRVRYVVLQIPERDRARARERGGEPMHVHTHHTHAHAHA
jgi:anaerobic glycerol-3-phosphate dehydrogenase